MVSAFHDSVDLPCHTPHPGKEAADTLRITRSANEPGMHALCLGAPPLMDPTVPRIRLILARQRHDKEAYIAP